MRFLLPIVLSAVPAQADMPVVEHARATEGPAGWMFSVTVRHADTGWDHYADGWSVIAPDGTVLAHRELLHPHETEQPFTRSLSGVAVPKAIDSVVIRAHDRVHGWGDGFPLDLR